MRERRKGEKEAESIQSIIMGELHQVHGLSLGILSRATAI